MAVITKVIQKNLNRPDQTRTFGESRMDLVNFDDITINRYTLMPGWSWEKDVKPHAGTLSCEATHIQYCLQGRLKFIMDDGVELEIGPGDAVVIPPGHKAYVVGSEPFVAVEFQSVPQHTQNYEPPEPDWDEIMNIE